MPQGVQVLVGRVKHRLIEALALDEVTQVKLAEEYGVSQQAVASFAARHRAAIAKRAAELAQEVEDELAHLWIANKTRRLEEAEKIHEAQDPTDPKGGRLQLDVLKYASEELGQLPSRAVPAPSTGSVVYQVEGVEPEDVT